ncbi:hypothetical protein PHMEG_00032057 [Phytophthora megakarya]|uniref:Uncharacterized protein n=1 Tax=Phytophthora megakarya TaxID=4795 RepID=A0A225UVH2_9STRA|nr:hypothetical protein PHMEG_00032057 [Phytophthora megakarya]
MQAGVPPGRTSEDPRALDQLSREKKALCHTGLSPDPSRNCTFSVRISMGILSAISNLARNYTHQVLRKSRTMTGPTSPGIGEAPPPSTSTHASAGVPSGSAADAVQGSLDHARALVAVANLPLAALSAEDRALREALLTPTYSLATGIRGSFIDVVRPERTAPELAGSLGFRSTGVSLPLGGTATPDLVAFAGPAQLPPPFVYLPAATEDIRALAAGNPTQPTGPRIRGPGGPLLDVFGSSRFGYRVLNTLHALRLALDRLRLLETARDLASNADPRSDVANVILRQVLEREVNLRKLGTKIMLQSEVQRGSPLASRLEHTETRYLDAERALTEARSEVVRVSTARDTAEKALATERGRTKTLQVVRTEVSWELVLTLRRYRLNSLLGRRYPPGGSVTKAEHDTEVRRLSKRIRKLRVSNQDLRTENRQFRTLLSPHNLFRFFNNQGTLGVMTGASEFQEHLSAYCRSEQPPYSVFLMVNKNNVPRHLSKSRKWRATARILTPLPAQSPAMKVVLVREISPSVVIRLTPILRPRLAPPKKSSADHSGPAKMAMVPGKDSLPAPDPKGLKSTLPHGSQDNSLLRPVPGASEANLLGHLFDAD